MEVDQRKTEQLSIEIAELMDQIHSLKLKIIVYHFISPKIWRKGRSCGRPFKSNRAGFV
jgi:hypothetical protein